MGLGGQTEGVDEERKQEKYSSQSGLAPLSVHNSIVNVCQHGFASGGSTTVWC